MLTRKIWDHVIDLKETFKPRKRKIYPLSKNEREECYRWAVIALSDHPRWMFRKNSIEFFVGLLNYLYYFYKWLYTNSPQSHVLLECSMIT